MKTIKIWKPINIGRSSVSMNELPAGVSYVLVYEGIKENIESFCTCLLEKYTVRFRYRYKHRYIKMKKVEYSIKKYWDHFYKL